MITAQELTESQKQEYRSNVNRKRKQIDQTTIKIPITTKTVFFGEKPKYPKKGDKEPFGFKYYTIIDLSEFGKDALLLKYLNNWQTIRYIKARRFGLNHFESMYYSLS